MKIKPIETEYGGYKFRSRLEARWAVFFDAFGIKYEYEPEGFVFEDGTRYLPDFRIYVRHRPRWNDENVDEWRPVYVEVKGVLSSNDEHKIWLFSETEPIIIVGDLPADSDEWFEQWNFDDHFNSFYYIDGDNYPAAFSKKNGIPWICGPDHDEWDCGTSMDKALLKARQARFEHGEKP